MSSSSVRPPAPQPPPRRRLFRDALQESGGFFHPPGDLFFQFCYDRERTAAKGGGKFPAGAQGDVSLIQPLPVPGIYSRLQRVHTAAKLQHVQGYGGARRRVPPPAAALPGQQQEEAHRGIRRQSRQYAAREDTRGRPPVKQGGQGDRQNGIPAHGDSPAWA